MVVQGIFKNENNTFSAQTVAEMVATLVIGQVGIIILFDTREQVLEVKGNYKPEFYLGHGGGLLLGMSARGPGFSSLPSAITCLRQPAILIGYCVR